MPDLAARGFDVGEYRRWLFSARIVGGQHREVAQPRGDFPSNGRLTRFAITGRKPNTAINFPSVNCRATCSVSFQGIGRMGVMTKTATRDRCRLFPTALARLISARCRGRSRRRPQIPGRSRPQRLAKIFCKFTEPQDEAMFSRRSLRGSRRGCRDNQGNLVNLHRTEIPRAAVAIAPHRQALRRQAAINCSPARIVTVNTAPYEPSPTPASSRLNKRLLAAK